MGKPISKYKEDGIRATILKGDKNSAEIAREHRVTYNTVNRIMLSMKTTRKYIDGIVPIYGRLGKDESYYPNDYCDELEAWSIPKYNPEDLKGWEREKFKKL